MLQQLSWKADEVPAFQLRVPSDGRTGLVPGLGQKTQHRHLLPRSPRRCPKWIPAVKLDCCFELQVQQAESMLSTDAAGNPPAPVDSSLFLRSNEEY